MSKTNKIELQFGRGISNLFKINSEGSPQFTNHQMGEVAPPFSFFDAPCPDARESIFAEDPAIVARRLIRPSRPAFGGYTKRGVMQLQGNCQPRCRMIGPVLAEATGGIVLDVSRLAC